MKECVECRFANKRGSFDPKNMICKIHQEPVKGDLMTCQDVRNAYPDCPNFKPRGYGVEIDLMHKDIDFIKGLKLDWIQYLNNAKLMQEQINSLKKSADTAEFKMIHIKSEIRVSYITLGLFCIFAFSAFVLTILVYMGSIK